MKLHWIVESHFLSRLQVDLNTTAECTCQPWNDTEESTTASCSFRPSSIHHKENKPPKAQAENVGNAGPFGQLAHAYQQQES